MKNKSITPKEWQPLLPLLFYLLQTLYYKFTAYSDSEMLFTQLGAELYGRIGLGCVELIAGILLVFRKTSHIGIGALLGLVMMIGAVFSHLTVIGINFKNGGANLVRFSLCNINLLHNCIAH